MASNSIEKVPTEIIPSSELTGLESALGELTTHGNRLPELKLLADGFTIINSKEEGERIGEILTEVRSIKKQGAFKMNPFLEITNSVASFLRRKRDTHEAACAVIEKSITDKIADFNRRERIAAEAEQRRINEENRVKAEREAAERKRIADEEAARLRREAEERAAAERKEAERRAEADRKEREKEIEKARQAGELNKREAEAAKKKAEREAAEAKQRADEEEAREKQKAKEDAERLQKQADADAAALVANSANAKVLPNKAKISGYRGGGNWTWEMVDINKIPRELLYPNDMSDISNFPRITKAVKDIKDKAKAEAEIPGISVSFKDR